jgi:hypothetical protein
VGIFFRKGARKKWIFLVCVVLSVFVYHRLLGERNFFFCSTPAMVVSCLVEEAETEGTEEKSGREKWMLVLWRWRVCVFLAPFLSGGVLARLGGRGGV